MNHDETVRILTSLLRASNEARPVLLLGAGASFSSGVPLAAECVKRLAKRVYAEKVKGGEITPEHVKLSEWQDWMHSHSWFIRGDDRLAENLPLLAEHLLTPREYRKRLLLELLHRSTPLGTGYGHLAQFVMRGLVQTILTTNFDTCIPEALTEIRSHIPHIAEVNRTRDDLSEFAIFSRAQVVWLHGRAEHYTDCNLLTEVEHLDSKLVRLLVPLLTDSPLIVVGYRGAERSVMHDLLLANAKRTHSYRNGIFWCVRPNDTVHSHVADLKATLGTNFSVLQINGFDELMTDLSHALRDEDRYPFAGAHSTSSRVVPFDDRPVADASLDELDWDHMLGVMRGYCEHLGRSPVTRETLPALLREQGLLAWSEGRDVPTVGCLLLFGSNPQGRFPHAIVAATIKGKKRVVFSGNLLRQRQELREWLASPEVNPLLRVKRRATHEDKPGYAERALVELLVNLLVHRDYELEDCARIDVEPGSLIRFANPGGLPLALVNRVTLDDRGRFQPLPNLSALRNRSLCDVFFGIREMERAGSGLADVYTLALEAGGDARFIHDKQGHRFVAEILQPAASAGSTTIARNDRPTGVYILNVLPFVSLPEEVSILRLSQRLWQRPKDLSLDGVGTFVASGDLLWSFVPLSTLLATFAPIVDQDACVAEQRSTIEAIQERRNILSWLIRKHFEQYLTRFASRGLHLETAKGRPSRRAYFLGRDGKPRMYVYDTTRRKAVPRQVVKQRAEGSKAWFENEGIGYEVTQVGSTWGVRIKPFYMFTGRDAATPLPAFARTSRATRRMKFDRNKNVDDDLTFWARFLSDGATTINIGHEHVQDLILTSSFLTVEVLEEGLSRPHDQDNDRMPA